MPQNKLKALLMESHWRIIMLIEQIVTVERSHLLVLLWKMVPNVFTADEWVCPCSFTLYASRTN